MRKSWLIAGGAILVVVSIGWMIRHRGKPARPQVPVATVLQGPDVTLIGALQAQSTKQVDAPVPGILDAWFVDIGGEVYAEQLVGRIRNADLDNALQSAQAAVDSAELRVAAIDGQALSAKLELSRTAADRVRARNELERLTELYERYKHLFELGALARLMYEKTDAEYRAAKTEAVNRDTAARAAQEKAAEVDRDAEEAKKGLAEKTAELEKAKEAVAGCDLHSPDDGVVLGRNIHQGDKVEAQQHLMTMATELTKLAVALAPDALALARIRAGQHAYVNLSGDEIAGEVHEVRGAEVAVWFSTKEPVTKLGTAAHVRIVF